jgi:hypothetical protein
MLLADSAELCAIVIVPSMIIGATVSRGAGDGRHGSAERPAGMGEVARSRRKSLQSMQTLQLGIAPLSASPAAAGQWR